MEPRAAVFLGWATDGSGSDVRYQSVGCTVLSFEGRCYLLIQIQSRRLSFFAVWPTWFLTRDAAMLARSWEWLVLFSVNGSLKCRIRNLIFSE